MKATPIHLTRKIISTAYFVGEEVRYRQTTYYFCGKAKNMTISAGALYQVTCEKCLKVKKRARLEKRFG